MKAARLLAPSSLAALLAAPVGGQETAPSTAPARPGGRVAVDGVAAVVDDEVILEGELDKVLAAQKETFGFEDPERWRAFRLSKLRDLVERRLYEQAARRRQVSETAIEDRVQRRIEEETRKRGSRGGLLDWLGQQGKTYDDFLKERKSEEYSRAFFLQEMGLEPGPSGRPWAEIYIRPGAMREYYHSHPEEFVVEEGARVRVLAFVFPSERWPDRAAARERLVEVRGRILAGADFAALARELSDVAAEAGGEIGWIERGSTKFHPEIVAFALGAAGPSLSPVVEWPEGLALVEVLEKRAREVQPFDRKVQEQIADLLWRERQDEIVTETRRKLLREAYIWPPEVRLAR